MPMRTRIMMAATLAIALIAPAASAQEIARRQAPSETAKAQAKQKARPGPRRDAARNDPHVYMGRPIADVMSYLGAGWLFRPEREVEEQPEKMIEALKIPQGATVADVGAGAGYTSLRLARHVGPNGVVLATDVQPRMLEMLIRNAEKAGIENITPILCSQTYTGLPPGAVDLILMVDVYHEMSNPEASLKGLRRALKPNGRLVLVEFRAEDPDVPIKPEHKMSVEQVRREIEPKGFRLKEAPDFLPWQHILIFEKNDEAAVKPAEPIPAP